MNILHTEASTGWGGQEIRILREAIGMRERGHVVVFVSEPGAQLHSKAKAAGFPSYELSFRWKNLFRCFVQLSRIFEAHAIDLVNTHSSLDSWIAGLVARIRRRRVLRTRHISAPIKPGLNSKVLYRALADGVVTTCEGVAEVIRSQAQHPLCLSIPTGIDPSSISVSQDDAARFRKEYGIAEDDCLIGTLCILRSWKGISDFLKAAKELKDNPKLKWMIAGSGPGDTLFRDECEALGLSDSVIFTGHLENPYPALAAMDIFTLLSTANEGVSQASLQAGYLSKPMVTTRTGGLGEVCIDQVTGYNVDIRSPAQIVEAVQRLCQDAGARERMGKEAHRLVMDRFSWRNTLDEMEAVYEKIKG